VPDLGLFIENTIAAEFGFWKIYVTAKFYLQVSGEDRHLMNCIRVKMPALNMFSI
jgi:hypothetical protein